MATIDSTGITGKTLAEYLETLRAAYLAIDPLWNINPETPDGQLIAIWSEVLANIDEQVQYTYQSIDPLTAIGAALDRICQLAGLTRQVATYSTATVTFTGVNGTAIAQGTQVRHNSTNTLWSTDSNVTVSSGIATVNVTCLTAGAQSASTGQLSIIATPVGGISAVTNATAASIGANQESDTLLRARRSLSVSNPGNNQVDSMYAAIANVDGVKHVRIYENVESSTDVNGVYSHSMAIFVDGGSNASIASAIAAKKNPGCGLNATNSFANKITQATTTPSGMAFTAVFYRPVTTDIHIRVTVSNSAALALATSIKQAIVDYANATLFGASSDIGFDRLGFGIGESIPAGSLYTPVNKIVTDVGYVTLIELGTSSGSITLALISIAFNGLAVFDVANITVTT